MRIPAWSVVLLACLGACAPGLRGPRIDSKPGKAGVEWIAIPGGQSFRSLHFPDARYPVTLKPFELARSPVTNRQYRKCVQAGACTPARDYGAHLAGDNQPVVGVTWHQARAFSEWVGGRLPSEAEWEYAARGASAQAPGGWKPNEALDCERAVVFDRDRGGAGCGRNATWPVCSKPLGFTRQGVCDMEGLVLEWVQDIYRDSWDGAPADGTAWEGDKPGDRVVRGTPWDEVQESADRQHEDPATEYDYLGFRPAR